MNIKELIALTKTRTKRIQDILYATILDYVVKEIYVKDDVIVFNQSNINIINKIDKLSNKNTTPEITKLKKYILNGIKLVLKDVFYDLSKIDVRAIETSDPVEKRIIKHAVRSLDQLTDLSPVYDEVKKKAIALMQKYEGISLKELRAELSKIIVDKNAVQKRWSMWTHDLYYQYGRIGSNEVRKELKLVFCLYEGGEMENTRDFCEERNGKVFHESEIAKWVDLDWEGKNEIGYNPFVDAGGYNCRHSFRWISSEMAAQKRPEVRVLFPNAFNKAA